jgi:hypothetical protein
VQPDLSRLLLFDRTIGPRRYPIVLIMALGMLATLAIAALCSGWWRRQFWKEYELCR